jgi:hypothetical protein
MKMRLIDLSATSCERMITMIKQFEDYVIPEPNSGCFLWIGRLSSCGYGQKMHYGKSLLAHRLAYELERGGIPNGLEVDHLCRVRSCVNTRHMEIVTHKENTLRGNAPTAINSRKQFCPRCSGPYTKDNRQKRLCLTCRRNSRRNKYAINKLVGTK